MKRTLAVVWLGAVGLAVGLSGHLKAESTHFFGIADQTEQTISFAHPVEVIDILAGESAEVDNGEPILRLRRPDLSSKLTQIDDQIRIAQSRHQENTAELQAELKSKQAERISQLAGLDQKIAALKSRLELNLKLVEDISGGRSGDITGSSPLATELKGLHAQRSHIDRSLMAHIQGLQQQLNQDVRPHEARIADLNNRKVDLQSQLTDLTVLAQFAGRVGTIKAKPGEHVAPYKPILTVHGQAPRFIKGYINENVHNAVDVGQTVWVYSQRKNQKPQAIEAKVESLGSRIVEYPTRLKRHPSVQAFGREAVVKLPPDTPLLLGEKVLVSMRAPEKPLNVVARVGSFFADSVGTAQAAMHAELSEQAKPISTELADLNIRKLEPSGIVFNPQSGEFLLVSDETGAGPAVILGMGQDGQVNSKRPILGANAIDDMESIRRVGPDYFVLASLSHNRKGERKSARCQMLRLREQATHFEVTGQLDLCAVLEEISEQASDTEARAFLQQAVHGQNMDIEAHDLKNGHLYLGFKSPWGKQQQTIILKLPEFSALLKGERQAHIWQRVRLATNPGGQAARLADMVIHNDRLYLLGVRKDSSAHHSELWSLNPASGQLKSLAVVPQHAFEGLSDTPLNQKLTLISDGGGKHFPHYLAVSL